MKSRPPSPNRRAAASLFAGAALLAGCATTPVSGPAGPVGAAGAERGAVYAEAVAAARQVSAAGRLREALWRWRIAEAVAPDPAAAREAAAAQTRLDAAADAADAEGARAAKAGRTAEAQSAYTRALELDPERPQARSFMRAALAEQVMADVNRLAGSEPKARSGARGKRARAPRRPRPAKT